VDWGDLGHGCGVGRIRRVVVVQCADGEEREEDAVDGIYICVLKWDTMEVGKVARYGRDETMRRRDRRILRDEWCTLHGVYAWIEGNIKSASAC
jgi:hypothetical protein